MCAGEFKSNLLILKWYVDEEDMIYSLIQITKQWLKLMLRVCCSLTN